MENIRYYLCFHSSYRWFNSNLVSGAVGLLFVSSAVTMAVPYSLGKVLDIIYSGTDTPVEAKRKLNQFCAVLVGVFLVGGLCNFGRIYIISCAGIQYIKAHLLDVSIFIQMLYIILYILKGTESHNSLENVSSLLL